jgi:uncharacterized protein
MAIELGEIEALFRYAVKSMRGEPLDEAALGWQGIERDRRVAVRRLEDRGEFPYLTASKLPELLLFTPSPETVRTPEGQELPLFGPELAADIARRHGSPVELVRYKHGIFDEAAISVITSDTIHEISRIAGVPADVRRFRPNILVRSATAIPFEEDRWVGGVLAIGDARITLTMRDLRCAMVNFDPDDASPSPEVLKTIARVNEVHAGVYATVTRPGRLAVGQRIVFHPS